MNVNIVLCNSQYNSHLSVAPLQLRTALVLVPPIHGTREPPHFLEIRLDGCPTVASNAIIYTIFCHELLNSECLSSN